MASGKATYWAAVVVVMFLLGGHFISKVNGVCVTNRMMATAQGLSCSAHHLLARTGAMLDQSSSPVAESDAALAELQGQFASVEASIARQQVACARVKVEKARALQLQRVEEIRVRVACPRRSPQVVIPQPPASHRDGTI